MDRRVPQRPETVKSYLLMVMLGLAAGAVTRLTDFLPSESIWGLQAIATLFGFWVITSTLVVYFSRSNKNAAINVFLYLCSMSLSFYGLKYLLGLVDPAFADEGFMGNLFLLYSVGSVLCGVVGYLLYFWQRRTLLSNILYALPIGVLVAEAIGVASYFSQYHTYLFQLVLDVGGAVVLGVFFYRKANRKLLYLVAAAGLAVIVYLLVYRPFL